MAVHIVVFKGVGIVAGTNVLVDAECVMQIGQIVSTQVPLGQKQGVVDIGVIRHIGKLDGFFFFIITGKAAGGMCHAEGVGDFVQYGVVDEFFTPRHIVVAAVPCNQAAVVGDGGRAFETVDQVAHDVVGIGFGHAADFDEFDVGNGADLFIRVAYDGLQIRRISGHRASVDRIVVIRRKSIDFVERQEVVFNNGRPVGLAAERDTITAAVEAAGFLDEIREIVICSAMVAVDRTAHFAVRADECSAVLIGCGIVFGIGHANACAGEITGVQYGAYGVRRCQVFRQYFGAEGEVVAHLRGIDFAANVQGNGVTGFGAAAYDTADVRFNCLGVAHDVLAVLILFDKGAVERNRFDRYRCIACQRIDAVAIGICLY